MDLIAGTNLAQTEMEKTINLDLSKEDLKKLGSQIYPPPDADPIEINHTKWRVKRDFVKDSDPLEVHISVYHDGQFERPIVTLVTLVEDMMWESVKQVPATS